MAVQATSESWCLAPTLAVSLARTMNVDRVLLAEPRGFCAGVEMAIKALAWMVRSFEPPVYEGRVAWKHDQQGIAEARLTIEPIDLWPAVNAIEIPTLLVKGGNSDFLPAATVKEVLEKNPCFSAVTVDNASHYVHDDQPEKFNEAVVRFVQSASV